MARLRAGRAAGRHRDPGRPLPIPPAEHHVSLGEHRVSPEERHAEHLAGPHRRPVARHPANRAGSDAVVPVPAARSCRALAVVPQRRGLHAAVLPIALDAPDREIRRAHGCARQHGGVEPRRHEHAAGVAPRCRLHHRPGRQVPQQLPVRPRAVRAPGMGSAGSRRRTRTSRPRTSTTTWSTRASCGPSATRRRTTRPTCSAGRPTRSCATAPASKPWFLYFSPNAPHGPSIPAPRYADAFDGFQPPMASPRELNDVRGKPGYVRAMPPIGPPTLEALRAQDLAERRTLLLGRRRRSASWSPRSPHEGSSTAP